MKTLKITSLSLILMAGMILPVFAAEVSAVVADHRAMAAAYQEKAAAQDALIAEHLQMKKDYAERFTPSNALKVGIPAKVTEMEAHCNKIINLAEQEKQQLLDFAGWHQMQASELEKG